MKKLILQLACVLLLSGTGWGQWASSGLATATVSDKTAGTSITDSAVNNTAEVGNVVVCVLASDNISTTAGDNNDHTSITDSTAGNTWTQAREYTNAGNAAAAATVSLWFSTIAVELTVTTTSITGNFNGSPAASALTCWEFTKGAGTVTVASGTDEQVDGADPGSMTLSGLTSREYLFFRAIATEADNPGMSGTVNYFTINAIGTSGGGAASNMQGAGEFRILTATGDSSNPTVASADHASVYVALWVDDGAGPPACVPKRTLLGVGC